MAIGLDIGTAFIVSARKKEDGNIKNLKLRNAFFQIDETDFMKDMFESIKVSYISKDNQLYILGDPGLELAASFNAEARRPMSAGMLSPKEKESLPIMKLMFEELLGKPKYEKEICYFSIPGQPIDSNKDNVYHEGMLKSIIESLGYSAFSLNEASAIVYSELIDKKLSGIGLSWGAGMINCAIVNYSIPVSQFSLSKSGDWIDQMTAQAQGTVASKITQIKEAELDLLKEPSNIILKTLSIYYDNLIDFCIKNISQHFEKEGKVLNEKEGGITVVIAGGTSMVPGFIDRFKVKLEENKNKFGFNINEVRHAKNPLFAVSNGCLIAALGKSKINER